VRGRILGLLEVVAAVWRVQALEAEVAAALAGRLAVALDLAALAFIAGRRQWGVSAWPWSLSWPWPWAGDKWTVPGNRDVAVALRPRLGAAVLALALGVVARRAHCVAPLDRGAPGTHGDSRPVGETRPRCKAGRKSVGARAAIVMGDGHGSAALSPCAFGRLPGPPIGVGASLCGENRVTVIRRRRRPRTRIKLATSSSCLGLAYQSHTRARLLVLRCHSFTAQPRQH
jgi:hypothetical protein